MPGRYTQLIPETCEAQRRSDGSLMPGTARYRPTDTKDAHVPLCLRLDGLGHDGLSLAAQDCFALPGKSRRVYGGKLARAEPEKVSRIFWPFFKPCPV
jgi:hypothetical protein